MNIWPFSEKEKTGTIIYDKHGKPLYRVEKDNTGRKFRINLREKAKLVAEKRRKSGAPLLVVADRRRASALTLLKEIVQFRKVGVNVPIPDLKIQLVKKIDRSLTNPVLVDIGGEGVVFSALDRSGRKKALKIALPFHQEKGVMYDETVDDKRIISYINTFKERFVKGADLQAEMAGKISSSGITRFCVPALSISEDPVLYLLMDWVPGVSVINRPNREFTYTLNLYRQILECVAYIHSFGVVHRDIKAGNIMLSSSCGVEKVYLIDWTTAKIAGSDRGLTKINVGLGTLENAEYSQLGGRNALNANFQSDIHSLGILLYEIIHCKRAPMLMDEAAYLDEGKHRWYVNKLKSKLPEILGKFYAKATNPDVELRYQSVDDMIVDWDKIIAEIGSGDKSTIYKDQIRKFGAEIIKDADFDESIKREFVTEFYYDCECCEFKGNICSTHGICEILIDAVNEIMENKNEN